MVLLQASLQDSTSAPLLMHDMQIRSGRHAEQAATAPDVYHHLRLLLLSALLWHTNRGQASKRVPNIFTLRKGFTLLIGCLGLCCAMRC